MHEASHQLRCVGCSAVIPPDTVEKDFRCVDCGELLEVEYPSWSAARRTHCPGPRRMPNPGALRWLWQERLQSRLPIDQSGVWRFRELLPILLHPEKAVTLREGNTPLYRLLQSAEELGLEQLYAKHQGMNPTGSFKDTGMTAALSQARERGFQWVACASTGNTSASMAAYASRARMNSLVLLPEGKISWSKLSQALDYGAVTCQLNTDFDGCVRVLTEVVRRAPVYLLNSVNPYRLEGQKTAALEIAEEFDWQIPDHLIVPGGNLANSSALGKGFLEMMHLGLSSKVPKISVVQAEGANPLYLSLLQPRWARNPAHAGQHPGHRHPHWKPGFLAQGSPRHPPDRRLLRTGQRSGDCPGESGDRPGRYRLRARVRRHPGRLEEVRSPGQDPPRRIGRAAAYRAHAQGFRVHHRFSPGDVVDRGRERRAGAGNRGKAPGHALARGLFRRRASCARGGDPGVKTGMKTVQLRLPATSANLGPGFDAMALALELFLEIDAVPAPQFSIDATGRNQNICAGLTRNLLIETYESVLAAEQRQVVPLEIRMRNGIPVGMGCGSSAAVRLAGVALASAFGELDWGAARIVDHAVRLEGHPDNVAACWHGGLTIAASAQQLAIVSIPPPAHWRALLVLPETPVATAKARSMLPQSYPRQDVVMSVQCVALLTAAFASGQGGSDAAGYT